MPDVRAPWSDGQVDSLNAYQACGAFHSFTCGNDACTDRDCPLVATAAGWVHRCGYTQDWAHDWMADWSWKPHADRMMDLLLRWAGNRAGKQ